MDLAVLFGEYTQYYFRVNLAPRLASVLSLGLPPDAVLLAVEPEWWFLFEDTEPPCHAHAPWAVPLQRLRGCNEVYAHFDVARDISSRLAPLITAKSEEPAKTYLPVGRVRQILVDVFGASPEELEPYAPVQRLRDDRTLALLYALGAYHAAGGALVMSRQLALIVAYNPPQKTDDTGHGT